MSQKVFRKNELGFSLIELLIILAILAILASVAIPAYTNYQSQAKIKTVVENWDAAVRYVQAEIAKRNIDSANVTTDADGVLSLNGNKKNPYNSSANAFVEGTINANFTGSVFISNGNIRGASGSITITANTAGTGTDPDKSTTLTIE